MTEGELKKRLKAFVPAWTRVDGSLIRKNDYIDLVVGEAKISSSWQISVIREVRPFLKVKPGDSLEYVLRDGEIFLRKAQT